MDMSSMAAVLPDLLVMLPAMLYLLQIAFYLFFIWFCGSIAMRGYMKEHPFMLGFGIRFMSGAICLVGGLSLAGFVPYLSKGMLKMMQLDIMVAGLSVSLLLAIAYRMITHDEAGSLPGDVVDSLLRKVAVLEDKLKSGAHALTEKEAIRKAEAVLSGYKASKARMVGNEWDVELKQGERPGRVVIDAWDGEIKKKLSKLELSGFFKDARKLAGLIIIIAVVIAAIVFFEGFPDPTEGFTSLLGMDMSEIANMSASMRDSPFLSGDLDQGCASPAVFTIYEAQLTDKDFLLDHLHEDEELERIIEESSGEPSKIMIRMDHGGKELILAVTESGKGCYFTDGIFCGCIESHA
ncbi:MAG: hypothetical protein JXC85_00180 [Candidatus Aenigmarchaeota archaeon]|nr:hypothetical protein [Candidatus Aenigmarchaeota archaeon]